MTRLTLRKRMPTPMAMPMPMTMTIPMARALPGVAALVMAALLTACAGLAPPPGKVVDAARIDAAIVPGATTRAALLEALGPTEVQRFDSGFEVWNYRSDDAGARVEVVILVGPDGVVRKLRRRTLAADEPG